jgi:acyl carrier protein
MNPMRDVVDVDSPHVNAGQIDAVQVDPGRLAALLRGDKLINDVAVMLDPEPSVITVLIVPQGYRPGHVLRQRVMRLAPEVGERLQVVLVFAIPRDPDGALDRDEALAATRRPGALYRYEPPATETERSIVELVREVLPGVQVSITDSLAGLGGDSLATLELTGLINERFGVDIDPQRVFEAESLRDLAAILAMTASGVT